MTPVDLWSHHASQLEQSEQAARPPRPRHHEERSASDVTIMDQT
jgi:hypothetical protein